MMVFMNHYFLLNKTKAIFLTFLFLILSIQFSWGTQYRYRPFEKELLDIPHLVVAHVLKKDSQLVNVNEVQRIYTYYEISVEDVLKGSIPNKQKIMVRTLGGTYQGKIENVFGSLQLEVAQKVLLFLTAQNQDQSYDIFGLRHGAVFFEPDGVTLQGPIITGDNHDHSEKEWNPNGTTQSHNDTDSERVWTVLRIKEFLLENENSNKNNTINSASEKNFEDKTKSKTSALPLQNKMEQAQNVEDATHSFGEEKNAQSGQSEEEGSGGAEKMDLMLFIIIGFIIILVIPFIFYQLLKKKPD